MSSLRLHYPRLSLSTRTYARGHNTEYCAFNAQWHRCQCTSTSVKSMRIFLRRRITSHSNSEIAIGHAIPALAKINMHKQCTNCQLWLIEGQPNAIRKRIPNCCVALRQLVSSVCGVLRIEKLFSVAVVRWWPFNYRSWIALRQVVCACVCVRDVRMSMCVGMQFVRNQIVFPIIRITFLCSWHWPMNFRIFKNSTNERCHSFHISFEIHVPCRVEWGKTEIVLWHR